MNNTIYPTALQTKIPHAKAIKSREAFEKLYITPSIASAYQYQSFFSSKPFSSISRLYGVLKNCQICVLYQRHNTPFRIVIEKPQMSTMASDGEVMMKLQSSQKLRLVSSSSSTDLSSWDPQTKEITLTTSLKRHPIIIELAPTADAQPQALPILSDRVVLQKVWPKEHAIA